MKKILNLLKDILKAIPHLGEPLGLLIAAYMVTGTGVLAAGVFPPEFVVILSPWIIPSFIGFFALNLLVALFLAGLAIILPFALVAFVIYVACCLIEDAGKWLKRWKSGEVISVNLV